MLPTFALPPEARNEHFAAGLSGFFEAPSDGMFTFSLTSDDGAVLWIGDEKVVENDGERAWTEASGQIALAGGLHSIAVGYFQGVGEKALTVHYAGPDGEKKPVVEANLFRMP